jgi:hypothetical protein
MTTEEKELLLNKIENAIQSDVIQLPPEEIDFQLIIKNPCTIMGRDGTVLNPPEDEAVIITSDNVILSDLISLKQITLNYVKNCSIERISLEEHGLFLNNCTNTDLIEIKAINADVGIKLLDCRNIEINGCITSKNNIGIDLIGTSSVLGNTDAYQGFGLDITPFDISPLVNKLYDLFVDGLVFHFQGRSGMTYNEIVAALNAMTGFNPMYVASIKNKDIIIKTLNETINLKVSSFIADLLTTIDVNIGDINTNSMAHVGFGLDVDGDSIAPIAKGTVYTFILDGIEIQFVSTESNGTTYEELYHIIYDVVTPHGYDFKFEDRDFVLYKDAPSIILTDGTRFKKLFIEIGCHPTASVKNTESWVEFGIDENLFNIPAGLYLLNIDNVEYNVNVPVTTNVLQDLVDILSNILPSNKYTISVEDNDILLVSKETTMVFKQVKADLFQSLHTIPTDPISGSALDRNDRTQFVNIVGTLSFENQIGIRLTNVNDIKIIDDTKVYSNSNIGIWQMPNSFNVLFRGEVYDNKNYGIRNSDKMGGAHDLDASESWFGDRTGPSSAGPGDGDKVSPGVGWEAPRQNGTTPNLNFPVIRDFILSKFGYPIVKVEITDNQIENCIHQAVFKYQQYMIPKPTYYRFKPEDQTKFIGVIRLPRFIPKDEIIEVVSGGMGDISALTGDAMFNAFYLQMQAQYNSNGSIGGGGFLSETWIRYAYMETQAHVLGTDPTYELYTAEDTREAEAEEAAAIVLNAKREEDRIANEIIINEAKHTLTIKESDLIMFQENLEAVHENLSNAESKLETVISDLGDATVIVEAMTIILDEAKALLLIDPNNTTSIEAVAIAQTNLNDAKHEVTKLEIKKVYAQKSVNDENEALINAEEELVNGEQALTDAQNRLTELISSEEARLANIVASDLIKEKNKKTRKVEYCDYLRVHPKVPSTAVAVKYNRPMTEEETDNTDWIQRFALAEAKEILGRVRSKYGSVPGPSGELTLDGQSLLSESQTERDALLKDLYERSEPLMPTEG